MKDDISYLKHRIIELEQEVSLIKRKHLESEQAKELYLKFFENFPALIWRANTDKLCDYFNSTWLDFTGRTLEQEYGNGWAEGVHPQDFDRCLEIFVTAFDKREAFSMEYRLLHKSGEYRWIRDNGQPYYDLEDKFLGYIGSCYDITESHRYEERLEKLSITDSLTQTYNRLKLDSSLISEIERAKRYDLPLSVIMLDIDHFKQINDTLGHKVGDVVLIEFTNLLKSKLRTVDILGRWGGEEFLIICPETDRKGAISLAEKLRTEISLHQFSEVESLTASLGVASSEQGLVFESIIANVDKALYKAKKEGRNKVKSSLD